ncbi:MAG TPA: RnfABCDGE type electron transport complex subunit D [archaeon]|nr:RnfABCDGE type electron transport complex subunit D [archaeon]
MDIRKTWQSINIINLMLASLVLLLIYNLYIFGIGNLQSVIVIVATTSLLDIAVNYMKEKRLFLPKTAIITGLILGLIIDSSLYLLVLTAAIAILSKHIIKIKGRHIFNPANFALFVALFLPVSESWWGMYNPLPVILLGLLIVYKLKRYHQVLPFLVVNAILTLVIFAADVGKTIDHMTSGILLFFVFYMMIEPTTSPMHKKSRIAFGILTGIFAVILYTVWLPAAFVVALFFADICVPVLDRVFGPKAL